MTNEYLVSSSDQDSFVSSEEEDDTWIQWFCSQRGNEIFCEVEEDFITDDFNLHGLSQIVPNYEYALDLILDNEIEESFTEEQQEHIEHNAEFLYGMIHSRYILTARGLQQMSEKFRHADFGKCPRVYCQGQAVLPVGLSDRPSQATVKFFCPRCQDVYHPKYTRHCTIEGAFFGSTFPHLLLLQYPDLFRFPTSTQPCYTPKIFGFKLHNKPAQPPGHGSTPPLVQQQATTKNAKNTPRNGTAEDKITTTKNAKNTPRNGTAEDKKTQSTKRKNQSRY